MYANVPLFFIDICKVMHIYIYILCNKLIFLQYVDFYINLYFCVTRLNYIKTYYSLIPWLPWLAVGIQVFLTVLYWILNLCLYLFF